MQPEKILLVQLYANGDCLYTTAVARQIKHDFPGCHLTWAIAAFCRNIIANNPFVDEVLTIDSVVKNDIVAYRKLKSVFKKQQQEGRWNEIFFMQAMDANLANYDGCIRSSIFNSYPGRITVPVTPVLSLTDTELETVRRFADVNQLNSFQHVVLFEYAPQSGQLNITKDGAVTIAESLIMQGNVAVILSSANPVNHTSNAIIDGSRLTVRETAALTHYCHLLLGCSSGITWISTSSAARQLPMVQLVSSGALWQNPVSRDFERFGLPVEQVIDLVEFDTGSIAACVTRALQNFEEARNKYNQPVPLQFNTTLNIVYNLLCYLEFKAIRRHIEVNRRVYGHNALFYRTVIVAILTFPFKLIRNIFIKRILKK